MLVGFGWTAQAHMQQMAATGVAPMVVAAAPAPGCSVSIIDMASGAAGGMARCSAGGWCWMAMR